MTSLIMFSGGLDSTYLAWMLTKQTEDKIVLHHVILHDPAGRYEHELKACHDIVNRLSAMREIEFTTSEYDPNGPPIGFDTDLMAMIGAREAFRYTRDVRVCMGTCVDDLTAPYNKKRYELRIPHKMFKYAVRSANCLYGDRKVIDVDEKLQFPLLDLGIDKNHMVENLPEGLRKSAWSCRQPINGKRCKQCLSCLAVQQS